MRLRGLIPAVVALLALALVAPSIAGAKRPPRPGVQMVSPSGQCTANFLFKRGEARYLGMAAHCIGRGEATDTNGCEATTRGLGTAVRVGGAAKKGRVVYSSWIAMQRAEEKNANACQYNDFALVKLSRGDARKASPTVPFFGGPTSLGSPKNADQPGDAVYSYGHSGLRPQQDPTLRRKSGAVVEQTGGRWTRTVYTPNSPGVPGDSGSGFYDERGRAIGTLSTLAIAPIPASNGVSDLAKEVRYARAHGMKGLKLVEGKKPFDPQGLEAPSLPEGLGL